MRVSQGLVALGLLGCSAAVFGELETGKLEIGNVVAVDASLVQPAGLLDSPAGCSSVTVFAHPAASGIYIQAYPWVGTPEYHKRGDPSFRFFPSAPSVWSLAQYTQGVATAYVGGVHLDLGPFTTIGDGISLPNGHTDANVQFTSVACPDTATDNNPSHLFLLNDATNGTDFFGGVFARTPTKQFTRVRKIAQSSSGVVVPWENESVPQMRLQLKSTPTPAYFWDLESVDGSTLYGRSTTAISVENFHVPARTWGFAAPAGVNWRSFSVFEVDPVGGEFQFQMPLSITVSSSTNGNNGTYSLTSPPRFANGGLLYQSPDGVTIRRFPLGLQSIWGFVSTAGLTSLHSEAATDSLAPVQAGATFSNGEVLSFTYPLTTAAPTTVAPTTVAATTAAPTTTASLCPTSKGLQIDDGAICYNGLDLRLSLENLSAYACLAGTAGVELGAADSLCVGTYNIAAMINDIAHFGAAAGPCGPGSKGLILDADHKVCFEDGFELVSATLAAYGI